MIKESKYIIRRILIGVGIVLVLSMINSCKVKAYDLSTYTTDSISLSTVSNNADNTLINSYAYYDIYKNINNNIYVCHNLWNKCTLFKVSSTSFNYNTIGIAYSLASNYNGTSITSTGDSSQYKCSSIFLSNNNLPKLSDNGNNSFSIIYNNNDFQILSFCGGKSWEGFNILNANSYNLYSNSISNLGVSLDRQSFSATTSNGLLRMNFFANYNWNYYGDKYVSNDNIINISSPPEFVSWNATKRSSNNVLLGYIFRPEFSNFDTDNYSYSYKFNNSNWLTLTENEQNIDINANGTIYVQIKDKNTNEVIDSATFTITKIGTFVNNQTYDITFSGDYRTENYLNNNTSSKSQSTIVEYQIYVDYSPKSSILKYQYQYVINGNSLDNNNWTTLASGNNGSFTYVASDNGTLYARILDNEDNVLKTATFTVNSIGLLAFDNNEIGTSNFFDKLRNKIDYGGPVSSLFILPVNFFSNLYNSMSNSNTCSNIQLGSLLGTNLSLPCVDIPRYFGSNVYNIIDFIFSFILLVGIFRFIIKKYNKFISMQDIGDDL